MRNLRYPEFLRTVAIASGTFSYRFSGVTFTVNPQIYVARHWPNGLPAHIREVA